MLNDADELYNLACEERDEWKEKYRELADALNWDTACLNCASLLDSSYDSYVQAEQAEMKLQQATKLLNYALTIRMYGERAPGGDENWREWDMRTEVFLRSLLADSDG
jgi:hypothetical protein